MCKRESSKGNVNKTKIMRTNVDPGENAMDVSLDCRRKEENKNKVIYRYTFQ